mgnify:FL=1|jgi:hypothetical protein
MVQKSIEGNCDMTDENISKKISNYKKTIKNAEKEIENLEAARTFQKSTKEWERLSGIKDQIEKIAKDNKTSVKKLQKIPSFYTLQHPDAPQKKAAHKDTPWVVDYIKNGGDITNLVKKAQSTAMNTYNKAMELGKWAPKKVSNTDNSSQNDRENTDPALLGRE